MRLRGASLDPSLAVPVLAERMSLLSPLSRWSAGGVGHDPGVVASHEDALSPSHLDDDLAGGATALEGA